MSGYQLAASKKRPRWSQLPPATKASVERLVGESVVAAENCTGGFSPGFASRLLLADGRRVFAKAVDADAAPTQVPTYRDEARVSAALPVTGATPKFLGSFDDGRWIVLAFEDVDGAEPEQPWRADELTRVIAAWYELSRALTPSPITLPRDHPRLGGWAELAAEPLCLDGLPAVSAWAAEHLPLLIALEEEGLAAAQGSSLLHFDLYPHNILVTPDRVVFVDWPHARPGAAIVDLVMLLSSAAASGLDPEPVLHDHPVTAELTPSTVDAVVAAHAGFCLAGGLYPAPPSMQPIVDYKVLIGRATVDWLRRRIGGRSLSRR